MSPLHTPVRLGVIGGMGPASTAYFYDMLTALTDAQNDQQHVEIVIYSVPGIPDRTANILDATAPSPLPAMIAAARALEGFGVAHIAIPCVTAHHYYDDLAWEIRTPVINMLTETLALLQHRGVRRAGLLATDGTVASGVFCGLLRDAGIDVLLPEASEQAAVMRAIYDCKAGATDATGIAEAAARLRDAGAETILLACTELSLLNRGLRLDGAVDMLEVLARRAVSLSGGRIRQEGL